MRTTLERNGNSEMSFDEINEEIKLAKSERKSKKMKYYTVLASKFELIELDMNFE